jgi:hypothetical protein
LDPLARAAFSEAAGSYTFDAYEAERLQEGVQSAAADTGTAVEPAASAVHDRREAEALLAALRRGKKFGQLADPAAMLEERHYAVR